MVSEINSPNVQRIVNMFDFYHPLRSINNVTIDRDIITIECDVVDSSLREINATFDKYKQSDHLYDVSVTGLKVDRDTESGSQRFCNNQSQFAQQLTDIIVQSDALDIVNIGNQYHKFVQVSKYFRWMRYYRNGQHFPHYDSDWVFPHDVNRATLYTLIVYWTDCQSGELAFCTDDRINHYNIDWSKQATSDQIYKKIKPKKGTIVLFPHSLCHSVLEFTDINTSRIITRGDLIFDKV